MKKMLFILIAFVFVSFVQAQKVSIKNFRKLELTGKYNYRNVLLSPDGRFLSYVILNNKNYYQYIYDLQKDQTIKLGKPISSSGDFLQFGSVDAQERTGELCWKYEKKYNELYFDFVHVVNMGKENLYTGVIKLNNPDLSWFQGKDIPENKSFMKYPKIEDAGFIQIFYPSFARTVDYIRGRPIFYVAFTVDRRLVFFDHQVNGRYKSIFQIKKSDEEKYDDFTTKEIYTELVPKFSPDDNYLVFMRDYKENSDILLADRKGRKGRFFSRDNISTVAASSAIETSPEWSPDGTKIAYFSDKGHTQKYSIWIYDLRTGRNTELVSNVNLNDSRNKGPQWVGNSGLLYVANDIQLKDPLMYYHIPTQKAIQLPTGTASNLDISVVPIGNGTYRVAFTSRGSVENKDELIWTKIYVMDLTIEL
ncbi:hypothetical protein Calab_0254 [Caldithrix abyssi DSM 13497]|uniref:WD40-like Beta Propeller Repeat n=1 Tax=Caldithrix abyssi DSM 13497 TaxID=880073 RepID=H1XNW3_CALAY|nr:PD40 domain-containing protein [Caldithrix abyssi]APF19799.1 WD40-like Beta Propeller Repeat [Caldithrix abyssi DSM 13497]EHO39903.1 hypothetical protein Calab_0254 [Caldithrix abyssi DSM 13497]